MATEPVERAARLSESRLTQPEDNPDVPSVGEDLPPLYYTFYNTNYKKWSQWI